MSEYKDFQVGQRVKVNSTYGLMDGLGSRGTVESIDPPSASWPINVKMDDEGHWGRETAPFDPGELDIV